MGEGNELVERLGLSRAGLRVLYMSGYNDEAILQHRAIAEGVSLLQKPFTADSLLRRVRDTLTLV